MSTSSTTGEPMSAGSATLALVGSTESQQFH
jgi:hypothetical protein